MIFPLNRTRLLITGQIGVSPSSGRSFYILYNFLERSTVFFRGGVLGPIEDFDLPS